MVTSLALCTAGCAAAAPSRPASGEPHALAARYLAIAVAGNHQLDTSFDRLRDEDKSDLTRSRADLVSIAATERLFDQQLLMIDFPPATADVAWQLVQVNEARATLTSTATGATSLGQLRAYERRLDQANGPVERYVSILRGQLGLPPPETS